MGSIKNIIVTRESGIRNIRQGNIGYRSNNHRADKRAETVRLCVATDQTTSMSLWSNYLHRNFHASSRCSDRDAGDARGPIFRGLHRLDENESQAFVVAE